MYGTQHSLAMTISCTNCCVFAKKRVHRWIFIFQSLLFFLYSVFCLSQCVSSSTACMFHLNLVYTGTTMYAFRWMFSFSCLFLFFCLVLFIMKDLLLYSFDKTTATKTPLHTEHWLLTTKKNSAGSMGSISFSETLFINRNSIFKIVPCFCLAYCFC